jgi:alpha-galactosidase
MGFRIVLIGGGSCLWTPTLAADLFLRPKLTGSELVLVDIDPEAARLLRAYCQMAAERIGTRWKVSVGSHRAAMAGADLVCASISTGAFQAMHWDYTIPEQFGVFHTVGDTVGPGGISRTLRNVPVFAGFARMMEKLCPQAWMVHVTNPLSQLTRTVAKVSSIKCAGLCHNYAGTVSMLARYFSVGAGDIDAVSVGVNHGSWMKDLTVKGRPAAARLSLKKYLAFEAARRGALTTETTDDEIEAITAGRGMEYYLNFELFERFGCFPVGAAPHVAENFPFYCNSPATLLRHRVRRKGVLPMRAEGKAKRRRFIADIVAGRQPMREFHPSREGLAPITEALLAGGNVRQIVAMPNRGQVSNLPTDAVVETHARVSRAGIRPEPSGPVPRPLLGWMQTIVDEQELAVEAALRGDREMVVQAMTVSPMLADKDAAGPLTDKLLAANRQYLPQFFKPRRPRASVRKTR